MASDSDLSPAEQAMERKMWMDRYFNLAENVVKEWIADYMEESPEVVFDDYKEKSDVIGTEEEGTHYTAYLDIYKPDEIQVHENGSTNTFILNQGQLKTMPKVSRAVSLVFDSVYAVYMPIVHTMTNMVDKIKDIFPKFDETTMSFELCMINRLAQEKEKLRNTVYRILAEKEKLSKIEGEKADELRKQLQELETKTMIEHNEITLSQVEAQQTLCDLTNAILKQAPRLCIVLERGIPEDTEHIMQRLPEFGVKYQDPDENTLIDQIKKEHNVE